MLPGNAGVGNMRIHAIVGCVLLAFPPLLARADLIAVGTIEITQDCHDPFDNEIWISLTGDPDAREECVNNFGDDWFCSITITDTYPVSVTIEMAETHGYYAEPVSFLLT